MTELLPALERNGVKCRIACLRHRNEGVEKEVPEDRVYWLRGTGLLARVRSLRQLVRELEPDIVHSALFRANLVARLACVGGSAITVNSLVNTRYEPIRFEDPSVSHWRLRLVQAADATTGRFLVDHYHAVSQAVAASAVRRLRIPEDRITVIQRGRDPDRLGSPSPDRRARARASLGISDQSLVLASVGRQDFQKGQEYLLRAIFLLSNRWPNLVLVVAGRTGSETQKLRSLAQELGIPDRIRWLGHREDLPEVLAASDIFVFPSRFEGFPGAVIEAMALELPVVAFDLPAIRELLKHEGTGLLTPPGDVKALADAVARILSDPGLGRRLGREAREEFLSTLTLDKSASKMAELYRALIRGE